MNPVPETIVLRSDHHTLALTFHDWGWLLDMAVTVAGWKAEGALTQSGGRKWYLATGIRVLAGDAKRLGVALESVLDDIPDFDARGPAKMSFFAFFSGERKAIVRSVARFCRESGGFEIAGSEVA